MIPDKQDNFFIPLATETKLEAPQSIASSQRLPEVDSPSLRPLKFFGHAIKMVLLLTAVLMSWKTFELFVFLSQFHWSLSAALFALVTLLLIFFVLSMVEFWHCQREIHDINLLQSQAEIICKNSTTGHFDHWLKRLRRLYRKKPHLHLLESALFSLPDYADDRETLQHLQNHLFAQLDGQALEQITRYSQQAALMTTLSPVMLLDALSAGWRSLKMLDAIGQAYGIRPSIPTRVKLLKMIVAQMALAGGSELIADHLTDIASNKLIGAVSSQAAGGIGVGLFTARIGFVAMTLCRPAPFPEGQKPGLGKLAREIVESVVRRFTRGG